ncbi:MAG: alpha-ketoglutarate-dependent dioxygenase AlkB [Cyanobacteria bacterium P01_G01_bin.54]
MMDVKEDYTILLDREGSSWLRICHLPEELATYGAVHFDEMFTLHPQDRAKVIMPCGEVACHRWQQSYLNTPVWNPERRSSYMFSGINPDPQPELPPLFRRYLDYMNHGQKRYNQMVVNWYQGGSDYIAQHADYEHGAVPGSDVAIITFNRDDSIPRTFCIKAKGTTLDSVEKQVEIELIHGRIVIMGGATQSKFRHGVPKKQQAAPRISITLRHFQVNSHHHSLGTYLTVA